MEVADRGDDSDPWEEQARDMLPASMAYDFHLVYELFVEEITGQWT